MIKKQNFFTTQAVGWHLTLFISKKTTLNTCIVELVKGVIKSFNIFSLFHVFKVVFHRILFDEYLWKFFAYNIFKGDTKVSTLLIPAASSKHNLRWWFWTVSNKHYFIWRKMGVEIQNLKIDKGQYLWQVPHVAIYR